MGRIFVVELEGRSYRCKFCKTHLALASDCVSRAFHCRRGKAYLFNNAHKTTLILFQHNDFPNKEASQNQTKAEWVNITIGALEERMMLSGVHTVVDTFCCFCGQILGWKYFVSTTRRLHMRWRRNIKRGSLSLKGGGSLRK